MQPQALQQPIPVQPLGGMHQCSLGRLLHLRVAQGRCLLLAWPKQFPPGQRLHRHIGFPQRPARQLQPVEAATGTSLLACKFPV